MNITKRKNAYRIRVFCGKDEKGNPKFVCQTIRFDDPRFEGMTERKRDTAARAIGFDFEKQINSLAIIPDITFKAFAEKWFTDYADIQQAATTRERCEDFKERVYEAIGDMRMDKIKTVHIQEFISSLTKPGVNKVNPEKGLSYKTIKHYRSFISEVFDYAIRIEMLTKNPCSNTKLPPPNRSERKIYTPEQAEEFVTLLYSEAPLKYQLFASVAIVCGLRRSEIVGLRYSDIDVDKQILKVERAANYSRKSKEMYVGNTKTAGSARVIKLPWVIINLFERYKVQEIYQKNFMGIRHTEDDYLFCDTTYKNIMYNGLPYNYLKNMCAKHGMDFYGIHSMRHFVASAMIAKGTDVKTVADILGHSNPNTTLSIYTHAFSEAKAKATDEIADMLRLEEKLSI
ncbi:MAG: site-specific integrase [Oscillospiraceae bacterium]|nr:site-specific integrase [Oscillospiraceae bacterium]